MIKENRKEKGWIVEETFREETFQIWKTNPLQLSHVFASPLAYKGECCLFYFNTTIFFTSENLLSTVSL